MSGSSDHTVISDPITEEEGKGKWVFHLWVRCFNFFFFTISSIDYLYNMSKIFLYNVELLFSLSFGYLSPFVWLSLWKVYFYIPTRIFSRFVVNSMLLYLISGSLYVTVCVALPISILFVIIYNVFYTLLTSRVYNDELKVFTNLGNLFLTPVKNLLTFMSLYVKLLKVRMYKGVSI